MHRLCHLGRVVACGGSNWCLKQRSGAWRQPWLKAAHTPSTPCLTQGVEQSVAGAQGRSGADMAVPPIVAIGGTDGGVAWPILDPVRRFGSDLDRLRLVRGALGFVRGDVALVLEG